MKAINDKVIVQCDLAQKNKFLLDGTEFIVPLSFEVNYREKSPVLCRAVSENDVISKGDILVCHHNTFYEPSPFFLYDDFFSIICNGNIIFAKINVFDGSLLPLYGNMLCSQIAIPYNMVLPEKEQKPYPDRVLVTDPGYTKYKKNQILFHRPFGWYVIVYNWNKELKRVCKLHESQLVGMFIHEDQ